MQGDTFALLYIFGQKILQTNFVEKVFIIAILSQMPLLGKFFPYFLEILGKLKLPQVHAYIIGITKFILYFHFFLIFIYFVSVCMPVFLHACMQL